MQDLRRPEQRSEPVTWEPALVEPTPAATDPVAPSPSVETIYDRNAATAAASAPAAARAEKKRGLQLWLGRADVLGTFGLCTVWGYVHTWSLPILLPITKRYRRERLMSRLNDMPGWARFCLKHLLQVEVTVVGQELLPEDDRGHMYICNHQSYVDIIVLMDALNTTAFLAKQLVKRFPVIGLAAYAGGSIFVERKDKDSRRRALEATIRMCRESTGVIVFPEGTRSADGTISGQPHPGAIKAAYEHGIKIIPIGLDGTTDICPKSMDRVNRGRDVAVTIGAPLDPHDYDSAEAWVAAVWGRVSSLYAQSARRVS